MQRKRATMMLRIISTIAFVVFGLFAGYATYQLGLGLYGIPLALATTAGLMWEIWIQPVRDDAMHKEMLDGLSDWDFKPGKVGNVSDAKETISILQSRVDYVTDAYAALKAEQSDRSIALDKLAELDADFIGNEGDDDAKI
jgi:hypothetical protein